MRKQRRAEIEAGRVVNIIVVDGDNPPAFAADWPIATRDARIGGTYDGRRFHPAPVEVEPAVQDDATAEPPRDGG